MSEFAEAIVHKQGNNLYVTHGDDSQTFVEFRKEAVKSEFKSEQAGVPIFVDVDYIRMMFPGDKTKIIDRPVKEDDKHRFDRQWRQYQETGSVVQDGTPITEWAPLTKGEALTLKASGIHTVQALAAMSDHGLNVILGARELREKAKAHLAVAGGDNAILSQLLATVKRLEIDNQSLKEQVAGLPAREEVEPKRKPGRPAKVVS